MLAVGSATGAGVGEDNQLIELKAEKDEPT